MESVDAHPRGGRGIVTAAIIGFQIVIFVSLAFARALGEDKLTLAYVGWTTFTFVMVAMSPLMLL